MFCIIVDKCLFFDFKGIRKKAQEIQKYNDSPHLLSRGGYELLEKKLMAEKRKIREEQAAFTEDPSLYLPTSLETPRPPNQPLTQFSTSSR